MKTKSSYLTFFLFVPILLTGCSKPFNVPLSPGSSSPTPASAPDPNNQPYIYSAQFAGPGSGNGQLANAHGIVADSTGNIYVADTDNERIQKFDSTGHYLTSWGGRGSGNGTFQALTSICLDSSDNIFVCDTGLENVQKFNNSGTFMTQWSHSPGQTPFNLPGGIACDSSDNIYVVDGNAQNVQKFSNSGVFLHGFSTNGSWNTHTSDPDGICLDSAGNIYTPDFNNYCVMKYNNAGVFQHKIGGPGTGPGTCGALSCGLFVTPDGTCFIADYGNKRVDVFKTDGTYECQWGNIGTDALGHFDYLCPSPSGDIYIVDNNVIKIFKP